MPTHQKHLQAFISNRLAKKYHTPEPTPLLHLSTIDKIIKPKNFLNPIRITYEQISISCTEKEYLKRYYNKKQFGNKRTALVEYYKFHRNWPWHADVDVQVIMMRYQEGKNKEQRKFIKKLMNQASSVSVEQDITDGGEKSRQYCSRGKEFSLKLKELDFDSSSIMLADMCMKIHTALCDVKPLYFYRGTYKDGVKEFKNFMMQKKKPNCQEITGKVEELKENVYQNHEKQNENKANRGDTHHFKSKFDSNKQFRKTFNIIPSMTLRKANKTQNLSRLTRNKTVNIKPQSFSKTTANETVSRDECPDPPTKKRNANSMRIRKCKSTNTTAPSLQKNKSNSKLLKELQVQTKKEEDQIKSKFLRPVRQLKRQNSEQKSKKLLKKFQSKTKIERSLTRQYSRQLLKDPIHQPILNRPEPKTKENALQTLIKSKLKLRA